MAEHEINKSPSTYSKEWMFTWFPMACRPDVKVTLDEYGSTGEDLIQRTNLDVIARRTIKRVLLDEDGTLKKLNIPIPGSFQEMSSLITSHFPVFLASYRAYVTEIRLDPRPIAQPHGFHTSIVTFLGTHSTEVTSEVLRWASWELELVQTYWMVEGSLYGAQWVLAPLLGRSMVSTLGFLRLVAPTLESRYARSRKWTMREVEADDL